MRSGAEGRGVKRKGSRGRAGREEEYGKGYNVFFSPFFTSLLFLSLSLPYPVFLGLSHPSLP